jgi:dCTP deaminase
MSIKSDKWFRRMCSKPTHVLEYQHGFNRLWTPASEAEIGVARIGSGAVNIREAVESDLADWKPMIEPYEPKQVRTIQVKDVGMEDGERRDEKVISYGPSSYGYDVRCGTEFKIFTNVNTVIVDPKNFNDECYVTKDGAKDGYIIIPPNGFALAHTVEYFRIPRNVLVVCLGKSTYARCGIIVNVTPLEPEWEGQVVLEFSNTTNLPAKVYVNEGCAQFLFLESDEECEVSYKDRGGKYMGQTGITLPKA